MVEAIFVLPKIRYVQRLKNTNASHMLTCLLHMKTFVPCSFTIVPILKCLNLDPSTLNCFKWAKFCFILQNQAREISVDIARSMYQGNQNKIQSQFPNNTNSKRSNWKKKGQNFPLDRVNQSLNLAKKRVEYLFNL